MFRILQQSVLWFVKWLYYVSIICMIGVVVGVSSHLIYGACFEEQPDYGFLAAFGFVNGLQYGGVWSGGAAIVLCVMRARKEYLQRHPESKE